MPRQHAVLQFLRNSPLAVAAVVFVLLFTSCIVAQTPPPGPTVRQTQPEEEDDIREAIFRYRIDQNQSAATIFLSVDGKDPTDQFMARFANSHVKVKKASGSYFKRYPFPGYLRDRTTGKRAIKYSVGAFRWVTSTRVEVGGGMYCGGLCADGGIYYLSKKNERWVVEKYDVRMIS